MLAPSCAVSGEVPRDPVVDPATGMLFERSLIEKHLQLTGTNPSTGEPLDKASLVSVKS